MDTDGFLNAIIFCDDQKNRNEDDHLTVCRPTDNNKASVAES